jgi:hypothetical protein
LLGFLLDAAARALIRLAAPGRMRVPA